MLNAAVIGLGWWGKHIIGCLDGSDCLKVVQAMDISSNEAGNFAASKGIEFTSDFEEVLKNPKIDVASEQEKFGKTIGTYLPYMFLLFILPVFAILPSVSNLLFIFFLIHSSIKHIPGPWSDAEII